MLLKEEEEEGRVQMMMIKTEKKSNFSSLSGSRQQKWSPVLIDAPAADVADAYANVGDQKNEFIDANAVVHLMTIQQLFCTVF